MSHLQHFSLLFLCVRIIQTSGRTRMKLWEFLSKSTEKRNSDISISASQILEDSRIKYTISAFHLYVGRWHEEQMLLRQSIECVWLKRGKGRWGTYTVTLKHMKKVTHLALRRKITTLYLEENCLITHYLPRNELWFTGATRELHRHVTILFICACNTYCFQTIYFLISLQQKHNFNTLI
jgi:hypothetical protein